MFGTEDLTEPQGQQAEASIQYLMLSLMQIACQSKLIHWQTKLDTEHRHFGLLFETFIEQMDTLVEAIAGKYGKEHLNFGEASIEVYGYETGRATIFQLMEDVLRGDFCQLFDRDKDSELYNLTDEILDTKNKVQYLLQFN
jgi:hypothetical protein